MIITRTPFRMSYVGGGTDISSFYKQEPGAVLSTAIDKYMFITLHKRFDDGLRVAYSLTEEVSRVADVKHPLVRESLLSLGIPGGVEITSTADIPAKGTGLGSSSSYTVGLLAACNAYLGKQVSPSKLAEMACNIEIVRCGEPIGKQDQFAAAFGGLKLYQFLPDDSVIVNPVLCDYKFQRKLNESTLIFYTGSTRSASKILAEQTQNSSKADKLPTLRRMTALAHEFKAGIESSDLRFLGELLKENWSLKKSLATGISNSLIDDMYHAAINAGALGGKLLGAGNGGFMMFFAEPEDHAAIVDALSSYRRFQFNIENAGSSVIYYG
jgi:D-glycero-alpha-D-manno-heptose-7-phosphate kinase